MTGILENTFSVYIEDAHPACNGHFEGNPVIPGVVTLEYVRLAIKEKFPQNHIKSFNKVKFTYSLKPGQMLYVHLGKEKMGMIQFRCFDSRDNQIAIGDFLLKDYEYNT